MPHHHDRDRIRGPCHAQQHEGPESSNSGWFKKHFGHNKEDDNCEDGSAFPYRNSETEILEEREVTIECERLRASGVPEWIIERKTVDNKRGLENLKKQLDEEELKHLYWEWDHKKRGNTGSTSLGWRAKQKLKNDEICEARHQEHLWVMQGKTRREIVQLKSAEMRKRREKEEEYERKAKDDNREHLARKEQKSKK